MRSQQGLVIAGLATCALAIGVGGAASAHALDVVMVHRLSDSVRARPAMTPKDPTKKLHNGWQADGSGGWVACRSLWPTRRPPSVQLTTKRTGGILSFPNLLSEVAILYVDAASACFMDDDDPEGPQHASGKATQHEEANFTQSNGSPPAPLQVRPRAEIAGMQPSKNLAANHGYFVVDYFNGGNTDFKTPDLDVTIHSKQSVLLWFGRDSENTLYSAVIDMGGFPNDPSSNPASVKILSVGKLCERKLADADQRAVGFARFKEPAHVVITDTCDGSVSTKVPDGTWVDCTPGCCMVTGFQRFLAIKHPASTRRKGDKRS